MNRAFEKIKERLEREYLGKPVPGEFQHGIVKAIRIVSEVEAEYGNGWIDVKDRLPEKDGYYLTCDHKGNIHVFYHHPSYVTNGNNMAFGICKNHPQYYQPIAWMELPNPYTRKKGELVCHKD